MKRQVSTILMTCSMLLFAAACGGGGGQSMLLSAPSQQTPQTPKTTTGFAVLSADGAASELYRLEKLEHAGQTELSVVATRDQQVAAVSFELAYDYTQYSPLVTQFVTNSDQFADSLVLEVLDMPGSAVMARVPIGGATVQLQAGQVVAEALFTAQAFDLTSARSVSDVPVTSAALSPLQFDAESGELLWYLVNPGDYDQNGLVSVSDLVPLGMYFGQTGPFEFASHQSVVDGNQDGEINLQDLSLIGMSFGNSVNGYHLYGSRDINDVPSTYSAPSVLEPLADFPLAAGSLGSQQRLSFSALPPALSGPEAQTAMYWVRPYGLNGADEIEEGTRSNLSGPGLSLNSPGAVSGGNPNPDFNLPPTVALSLEQHGTHLPLQVSFDASASNDPDGQLISFEWDFEGDGLVDAFGSDPLINHYYRQAGVFSPSVRITDNNGAWAAFQSPPFEASFATISNIEPSADLFGTALAGEAPLSVGFIASGSSDIDGYVDSFHWDFDGDGTEDLDSGSDPTVMHTFDTPGSYEVQLTVVDNRGGTALATWQVEVIAPRDNIAPAAQFSTTPTGGLAPLFVELDASASIDADGSIVRYDWDLDGDGGYDVFTDTPTYSQTFAIAGSIDIGLKVTDNGGLTGFAQQTISVNILGNELPTASLAATPEMGIAPLLVGLDASGSSDADGSIVRYDYDFDNDGIWDAYDAAASVNWTYLTPGSYTARVRVTDDAGAQATAQLMVTVNAAGNLLPVADLDASPANGTAPLLVEMDAAGSSDPDGTLVNYEWDFNGDGLFDAYGELPSAAHTYNQPGVYQVRLRVTDNQGAQAMASFPITVNTPGNDLPIADLTATPALGAVPLPVVLSAAGSSDPDGTIVLYEWDFNGDGLYDGYGSQVSVNHTYTQAGPYLASVRVTDDQGAQATAAFLISASLPNNMAPIPALIASPPAGDAPLLTTLDATASVDPDGSIVRYDFDFNNDGIWDAYDAAASVNWTFTSPGLQTVRLRLTDDDGSQSETTTTVTVNALGNMLPIAVLTTSQTYGPAPLSIILDASASADPDGSIVQYDFDFNNDGIWDAYDAPDVLNWTFNLPSANNVTLRVTDNSGAQHSAMVFVSVNEVLDLDHPWGSFGHDPRNTRRSPYVGAQTNNLKWSYTTGDDVNSSPVIATDGTVYVGSRDKRLYALNPDGTLKWSYTTGAGIYNAAAIGADGTIYVGSRDEYLYALNPDGTLKWSYKTGDTINAAPAIGADGTIYIGSYDNKLHAVNPDGSFKWSYATGNDIDTSSAAIGIDGTIYVGSWDDKLHAINPDGTFKWSFTSGSNIEPSPAIGSDGTVYVGSWDGKLYAIHPDDGTLKWSFNAGSSLYESSSAIGADGTIYIGGFSDVLRAINPDGSLKWGLNLGNNLVSSPTVGGDGTIYIGCDNNNVYAVNPDGTILWSYATGDDIYSSPSIGADGTVYVGSKDNKLYAFGPTI